MIKSCYMRHDGDIAVVSIVDFFFTFDLVQLFSNIPPSSCLILIGTCQERKISIVTYIHRGTRSQEFTADI